MVVILFVSCHIYNFFCDNRVLRIIVIDLTIRSLDKSIFINSCITCKRVDQTNVRSLRCLDRAHSSIMRVVYISYLESGTVSWQTTRSQRWKTSLMSQLTQRVILIHELWQLWRSKKLFHCCCYRLNVDQRLWWNAFCILCSHTLTYHTFQSGQTDTVLVLQKFSYGTNTTVTQVVDIIIRTNTILQMHVIVNRSKNIFLRNMLRNQVVNISVDRILEFIDITCCLFQDCSQNRIIYLLCHAQFSRIYVYDCIQINHHVRENFDLSLLFRILQPYSRNSRILNLICYISSNLRSFFCNDFTCQRAYNRLSQYMTWNTVLKSQLFIKFVTANLSQIITSRIKEHAGNQTFRTVYCQRLARTDLLI